MFDRVFVINLDRRPDRWEAFRNRVPADWPFAIPERWSAKDWQDNKPPQWFQQPRGAWGCLLSHLGVWRQILDDGLRSALIFEDDAGFGDAFGQDARSFCDAVPADWKQIYLGGQHFRQAHALPVEVKPGVLRCANVNRLHAYAVRSEYAEELIEYVPHHAQETGKQIDYLVGDLCEARQSGVYAPIRWLVGQAANTSDIARDSKGPAEKLEQWWQQYYYVNVDGDRRWSLL
jgi:GR25 family glycosyltransferase involved in LPS biosynthesis